MEAKKYRYTACHKEGDGNIVFAEYLGDGKVDLTVAKEIVANRLEFTENKEHYLIFDFTPVKQVTAEAKAYMQRPDGGLKNILGAAFLARNLLSALIANIFMKTPKEFETKFFHRKEDAINWIDKIKAEKEVEKNV